MRLVCSKLAAALRRRSSRPASAAEACGCSLLQLFAPAAKLVQLLLNGRRGWLQRSALILERRSLLLAPGDQVRLLVAGIPVALAGQSPVLQPPLNPGDLRLHLPQRRAGVRRLPLSIAPLVRLALNRRVQLGNLMLKLGACEDQSGPAPARPSRPSAAPRPAHASAPADPAREAARPSP